MNVDPRAAVTDCVSCGQPLSGPYCSRCGERVLDPDSLTIRHFARTAVEELGQVDGKLWRTVRALLFKPGFLSSEYAAGRRRMYVNPIRLLLTAIVLYALFTRGGLFVTLTLGPLIFNIAPAAVPADSSIADTVAKIDRGGVLGRMLAGKAATADIASPAARERFHRRLNQFAQPLSFANVFLLALALFALFHRRRRLLVEHAAFSMHLVSFMLLSSLILVPVVRLLAISRALGLTVLLAVYFMQSAYMAAAIRRFYLSDAAGRGSLGRAAAVAFLIYLLNSAFITGVQMLGGAIAIRAI